MIDSHLNNLPVNQIAHDHLVNLNQGLDEGMRVMQLIQWGLDNGVNAENKIRVEFERLETLNDQDQAKALELKADELYPVNRGNPRLAVEDLLELVQSSQAKWELESQWRDE